jgi:hypothetical protein
MRERVFVCFAVAAVTSFLVWVYSSPTFPLFLPAGLRSGVSSIKRKCGDPWDLALDMDSSNVSCGCRNT